MKSQQDTIAGFDKDLIIANETGSVSLSDMCEDTQLARLNKSKWSQIYRMTFISNTNAANT